MQANKVYSGVMNELHFEFEHRLFDEKNVPVTPMSLDFVTADGTEFWASWNVKYFMKFNTHKKAYDFTTIEVQNNDDLNIGEDDIAELRISVISPVHHCILSEKFDTLYELWAKKSVSNCVVEVSKESKIEVEVNFHHQNKSIGRMVMDFAEFWENKNLCDVTFVVEGKEIKAHKQILAARNVVFAKMFQSNIRENGDDKVEIKDAEHIIFLHLLKYFYLGKVDSKNVEDYKKLIVVANKYSMESLVSFCETYLACKLTKDNVVDIFVVTDLVSAKDLKNQCKHFMYNSRLEVVESSGYKNLVDSNHANLLSELHCYILKRLDVENKRLNRVRTLF